MTLQVFTLDCECLHLTEIVLQSAVCLMVCRTSDAKSHFLHANAALPADSTTWEHRGYTESPGAPLETPFLHTASGRGVIYQTVLSYVKIC